MTRSALAVIAVVLAGCPAPPVVEGDAGQPMIAVFDGPTQNGGIPPLPEAFAVDASFPLIDSGVIEVDRTCCSTNFSLADREPAGGVSGVLRIGLPAFSTGIPLVRGGGRWAAMACFPVNQSTEYRYEFTFDAGVVDGGMVELDDGGIVGLSFIDIQVTYRASDDEPGYNLADGTATNYFRSVSDCDGLDGSVPR